MSRDLLGDETADPPPMNAPLPWRVFQVGEDEWYVARSLAEAKAQAAQDWGYASEDPEFLEMVEDAHELLEWQMTAMKFHDPETGATVSFRDELARQEQAGIKIAGFFAGRE